MSDGALGVGSAPDTFHPTINERSRRLVSGLLSVEARQRLDIERREKRRQDLLAKVERERQRTETFAPVTNRRVLGRRAHSGVDGGATNQDSNSGSVGGSTVTSNAQASCLGESFRPVTYTKSQRTATNGTWRSTHQQLQEVRQRVRELWRTHAGVGSREITLHGVYAVLKELGLQVPSAIVEKFLLALGIDEAAGVRCVPYDRFMKVFVVVLRDALVPSSVENSSDDAGESPQVSTASPRRPAPTMRRVKRCVSAPTGGREEVVGRCQTKTNPSSCETPRTSRAPNDVADAPFYEHAGESGKKDDDKSPSPVAFSFNLPQRKSVVSNSRTSGGSPGLSCSAHRPQATEKKVKRATYDPLEGCTFAPTINRKSFAVPSRSDKEKKEKKEEEARPKSPAMVYKSREDRELEECTFAPDTARFHKRRDALAWWTRESFSDAGVDAKNVALHTTITSSSSPSIVPPPEPSTQRTDDRCESSGNGRDGNSSHRCQQPQRPPLAQWTSPIPIAAGFDKAVQRMTEARKKSRAAFEDILRSSTEQSQKPLRSTVVQPFLLHSETRRQQRERRRPVLYVDVDLPSGKTGRIGVCKGDKAADLARGFGDTYGLNDELRMRLERLLAEKLGEVFGEDERAFWL